jgi:hypothetical protein
MLYLKQGLSGAVLAISLLHVTPVLNASPTFGDQSSHLNVELTVMIRYGDIT